MEGGGKDVDKMFAILLILSKERELFIIIHLLLAQHLKLILIQFIWPIVIHTLIQIFKDI